MYPNPRLLPVAAVVAAAFATIVVTGASVTFAAPRSPAAGHMPEAGTQHRGVVKAVRSASLSTELMAPVSAIGFREGERFKRGDQLIAFDCGRQSHEREAFAAQAREMRVAVESAEHLARNGAGNRTDIGVAKARFDRAIAEVDGLDHQLRQCRVFAPFDGVVTELSISVYEMAKPNQPFMSIVDPSALEIEIIVPSRVLPELRPGTELTVVVDETSRSHRARLSRTGGAVDPMSQTVKVYAVFVDADASLLPGMSGTAEFVGEGYR